tara:strand:+ start:282 stop:527 length:246 start_codon:yes stop_codon:yes gene_type:complete
MKVITLTRTSNKEIFINTNVFFSVARATKEWNGIMLDHKEELLQVDEVKKELKDNDFLLFTFVDGFGRKQSIELKSVKVTV